MNNQLRHGIGPTLTVYYGKVWRGASVGSWDQALPKTGLIGKEFGVTSTRGPG